MREPVGLIERNLTLLMLIYTSGAFFSFRLLDKGLGALSYIIIPSLLLSQIIKHRKRCAYVMSRDVFLVALIVLAIVSLSWSYTPQITLPSARGLIRLTLFGVYFAIRYNLRQQLDLILQALGISAFLALLIGILIPSSGISSATWRGGFAHKNLLARTMVFYIAGLLCVTSKDLPGGTLRNWTKNRFGLLLSIMMVALTRGKTAASLFAFLVVGFVPARIALVQKFKKRVVLVIGLALYGLAAYVTISASYKYIIVNILGKDLSLSGRTQLWEALIGRIAERPLLGYGYYGFWMSERGRLSLIDEVKYGWVPTHAHSGFLDLLLMLGIVGFVLFSISFILSVIGSFKLALAGKSREDFWPLAFILVFFLFNANITISIISPSDISWAIYVSTAISVRLPSNFPDKLSETDLINT